MLEKLIIDLYEATSGKVATDNFCISLHNLLEENDLVEEDKVPNWFIDFIESIVAKKAVKRMFFAYDSSYGDVTNFIAELEGLIDADWDDYGEAVEVYFPKLDMYGCISTEGNFYEVKAINMRG